jgi:hypothetical protein
MRLQGVGLWSRSSRRSHGCQTVPALLLFLSLSCLLAGPQAWAASGSCTDPENPCTGCCNADNECCDSCCGDICCSANATCCSRWDEASQDYVYTCCPEGSGCCNGNCCASNECCSRWDPGTEEYVYQCCAAGKVCTGGACCDPGEIGCEGTCCDDAWSCCDENGDFTYDDCPQCSYWYFGVEYLVCFLCDQTPTDGNNQADACNLCDSDWDDVLDSCYLCDKTPTDANNVNDACYLCDNPTHASDPNDQNDKLNDCYLCDQTPDDGHNVNDACMLCDDPYHATDPTNLKSKNNSCYPCKNKIAGTQNDDCYRCDKKKADGTPGEDGKNDTCYGYDTDGNGVKESCCPTFRIELTFTDDFTNRSKSSAGVGETGSIVATQANGQTMGAVTYTTSDANCVAVSGDDWTARDHNCSAQLCAEADGCKQCKTLTVKEPDDLNVEQIPGTCVWHEHNKASVGFKGDFFITPADVSFRAIEQREGHCVGVGIGYFAGDNGQVHPPSTAWKTVNKPASTGAAVGKGSKVNQIDTISSGPHTTTPYKDGTFTWPIPQEWRLGTKTGQITITDHKETIDAGGNMTISKGGTTKSAAYGAANSNYSDSPCVIP